MSSFSFEIVDKYTPDHVIEESLKGFNEETRGYVTAEIKHYSGEISSYIVKTGYWFNLAKALEPREEVVDIQKDLGVVNGQKYRFEVFLTVKGLENYKYRMMLIQYSTISYPVTVVLSEDIAIWCIDSPSQTSFEISNMQGVRELMDRIFHNKHFREMVQQLINEALRREALQIEPPPPIGRINQ